MRIWGELVPCTYFLGVDGLTEEKKKELWVKVCCDIPEIQAIIDRQIHFRGTLAYTIYRQLMRELL